ncbi:MAG: 3-hydroxyacyl-CoA dehydrogenase family protein [Clostridiales Family XIII bacterium]|jgi:3-hydroxybutyryl-CoA dehydrogenase|nr:3-hydroxyacyl-CoA dehydrogenase family protein [Clostridiales Family XIII bacterium]
MKQIKKVVVIGAGMMGNALAQVFASNADLDVTLRTRQLKDDRYEPIKKNLDIMIAGGAATEAEKEAIVSRISFVTDLKEAAADADFIIECAPEVMEVKQDLFKELEGCSRPDTIFATNTSVMSPTEISAKCERKERVVGAHFWNPGHLIPLVEVVKSDHTSEEVMDATMELLRACGKKPIYCKKDVPGFVANRLQHALWREAFYMVQEGIADPATVDDACKYGPGLRWPALGPMENSDMVGIQLSYNIHDYILKHLADNHEPSPCLKEMLDKGDLGFKTGKGWQEWTPAQIEASNTGLREYLIAMTAKQK